MQVVMPVDIEYALASDLTSLLPNNRIFAPPPRDDLKSGDILITRLGGAPVTPVTHVHDISIDVWGKTEARACALANKVCGIVSSLPFRTLSIDYKSATANMPYANPDPKRPNLPRYTFTASVTVRGENINFKEN